MFVSEGWHPVTAEWPEETAEQRPVSAGRHPVSAGWHPGPGGVSASVEVPASENSDERDQSRLVAGWGGLTGSPFLKGEPSRSSSRYRHEVSPPLDWNCRTRSISPASTRRDMAALAQARLLRK